MESDNQSLLNRIEMLEKEVASLRSLIEYQALQLKKKWRQDIKEELRVYHSNLIDSGDDMRSVSYSD